MTNSTGLETTPRGLEISRRALQLFRRHKKDIFVRTDQLFFKLFIVEYIAGIVAALVISPRTWVGNQSSIHIHVYAAVILGALIFSFPMALIKFMPGKPITRHAVAISQALFSGLLIHLTGGRIETHFHIFGSLAFLGFYRDWRVLVSASFVIAIDHFLRGLYWPQSVYGIISTSSWRWMEHTGWVIFEDIFLFLAISQSVREMQSIAYRQAEAEANQVSLRISEKNLEEAKLKAEEASETKSAFLANMSHEIRTPLSAILGFTQLMLEDEMSQEEQKNILQTIHRNGDQLNRIINDILDISKVEANKIEVEKVRFEIDPVIDDVISLFSVKAMEKGLALNVCRVGPLPDTIVSDPTRFRQILMNIIGNAIKFTEHGKVDVVFRLKNLSDPNVATSLEVSIEDTGHGIGTAQRDRLFQPFTQADSSTSRRFGGTGLGLYLSKQLAQVLGGDLRLERSVPGKGTSFVISIDPGPLEARSLIKTKDDSAAPEKSKLPRESLLKKINVLVVDDSLDNLQLISQFLGAAGATLDQANGALKAIEILRNNSFHVVLMDIQMPGMDGYEAVRNLRRDGYRKPIIALTANAMKGDKERCLEAGFDAYLVKPIDRSALIKTVLQYSARVTEAAPASVSRSLANEPDGASLLL